MTEATTRKARGQALVEFALAFPVFLIIVFGLIDGGRLIFTHNAVANSARNAARVAIVNQAASGSPTCDTTASDAYAVGCAVSSGVGITVDPSDVAVVFRDYSDTTACGTGSPAVLQIGCLAVVTVSAEFSPLTPILSQMVGSVTLSSTSKMPIERVCSSNC